MTTRGIRRWNPAATVVVLGAVTASALSIVLLQTDGWPGHYKLSPLLLFVAAGLTVVASLPLGRRSALRTAATPLRRQPGASVAPLEQAREGTAIGELAPLLFNLVDEAVLIVEGDRTIFAANAAARRLLAHDACEGRPLREVASLFDARGLALVGSADPFARAAASGQKYDASALLERPDGTSAPVRLAVLAMPSIGAGGRFIVLLRDRSAGERQFRATAELVAEIVHDLRTPLTALQGFAELLADESAPKEAQREWMALIRDEAVRMGQTIEDILDDARLQLGRASVRCADARLESLVEQALSPFQAEQTHDICVRWEGARAPFHADGAKVARALTNLVANAVKYSPAGSPVCLRVLRRSPDRVVFEVTDCGPGVPEEDRERIFEPFFRGARWDDARSGVAGSGLGLTIVRSIARLHDGDVTVRDDTDGGAVFTLTIREPLACQHRPAETAG